MAATVTWENVRFSALYQDVMDVNGWIWVPFNPPFPTVCHGLAVSLDDSGGAREWLLGISGPTTAGFSAAASSPTGAPAAPGQFLGVHYIAFGE